MRNKKFEEFNTLYEDDFEESLEPYLHLVKKYYPLKTSIIKGNILENILPHAEIIHSRIESGEEFSKNFYSYIIFHQIHSHLKNYLLKHKNRTLEYRNEFLDVFQDIFLDNFLIFREISLYSKSKYDDYMNIWLDGFFISLFRKIIDDAEKKYHKIQPHLFFIIILFMALPNISHNLKEIYFKSIITFHNKTRNDWETSLEFLKNIQFDDPLSKESLNSVKSFLLLFLNLDVSVDDKGNLFLDELNKLRCVDLLDTLDSKTDNMIASVKKLRPNVFSVSKSI